MSSDQPSRANPRRSEAGPEAPFQSAATSPGDPEAGTTRFDVARRKILIGVALTMACVAGASAWSVHQIPGADGRGLLMLSGTAVLLFTLALISLARRDLTALIANLVYGVIAAAILVRIHQIMHLPGYGTAELTYFMPAFAFAPLLYGVGSLLASARVALFGNLLFWLLQCAITASHVLADIGAPDASTLGLNQLLTFMVLGNPVFILLFYLTARMRVFYEQGQREMTLLRGREAMLRQLNDASQRFDQAAHSAQVGLWDWPDIDVPAQEWSNRMYRLLGIERGATRPELGALMHPDDKPLARKALRRHFRDRARFSIEARLRIRDADDRGNVDGYRWFRISGKAARNGAGRAVRMSGSLHDVHDRRTAQDALFRTAEQLRAILRHAPSVIYTKDLEGRYLQVNPRWCEATGVDMTPEQVVGRFERDLMDADLADRFHAEDIAVAKAGTAVTSEDNVQFGERAMTFLTHKFPLRDANGQVFAVSGISTDITDLRAAMIELEIKSTALAAANDELERFTYTVSHDLSTPLRAMQGFAGLLRKRLSDQLDDTSRDFVEQIEAGGRRAQQMIAGLLELSRAGAQSKRERVDLGVLCQEAVAGLEAVVSESGARVDIEELPTIHANPAQIRQVFQNLIHNAIKFVPEARTPCVTVTAERASKDVIVHVADNGVGIPERQHAKIFEAFHRLYTDTEYAGLGIGLSLCERVVRAHGGQITVDSTVDMGTTFSFRLPIGAPGLDADGGAPDPATMAS